DITVDGTLTKVGNQLSRAAITGDITIAVGSNASVLVNTGPGATGPIGSASSVPVITIDAKGRVTALTSAALGSAAALNTGNSVVGISGGLERVIRYQGQISGASKVYVAADMGKAFSRTNSGAAMTDTLPSITAAMDGWTITLANDDTTLAATNTIS